MENKKHTETPWRVGNQNNGIGEQEIEIRKGDKVLFCGNSNFYEQSAIDAEFIVDCVNNNEKNVKDLAYVEGLEVHVMQLEKELKDANNLLRRWNDAIWCDFLNKKGDILVMDTTKHLEKVK